MKVVLITAFILMIKASVVIFLSEEKVNEVPKV